MIPEEFLCPITREIMKYPVICEDGNTYEQDAINRWVTDFETSPITREEVSSNFIFNRNLKKLIDNFLENYPEYNSNKTKNILNQEPFNVIISKNEQNMDIYIECTIDRIKEIKEVKVDNIFEYIQKNTKCTIVNNYQAEYKWQYLDLTPDNTGIKEEIYTAHYDYIVHKKYHNINERRYSSLLVIDKITNNSSKNFSEQHNKMIYKISLLLKLRTFSEKTSIYGITTNGNYYIFYEVFTRNKNIYAYKSTIYKQKDIIKVIKIIEYILDHIHKSNEEQLIEICFNDKLPWLCNYVNRITNIN